MKKFSELSVFFPAFNEEANIKKTVFSAKKVLNEVAGKWEIIVVDDGSTDQTANIVKKIAAGEKKIRLVSHFPNRGYGEALTSGFYSAKYRWVAMTDADGQFDFAQIREFYPKTKKAEVVVGFRTDRRDPWHRKLFGWGWTLLANILLGIKVRDVDCGFKLVNKKVLDQIPRLKSVRGGMISPELIAKAVKAGFRVEEVGVRHYPRQEGHQTGADLKVIINSFFDLGKLWWELK